MMNEQNEQSILDWIKDYLNLSGLRSLFSRRFKNEVPASVDTASLPEEVRPKAQEQFTPSLDESNVIVVTEVDSAPTPTNELNPTKIAHVVITADIPEGLTLNITIQANAEANTSISSRIIPATLDIAITRVLPFIIPATIFIVLGIEWVWDKAQKKIPEWMPSAVTFIVLSLAVFIMLNNALNRGPFWTNNYGLFGLQYGAKQIFVDTIPTYLKASPKNHIYVSSIWANGSDNFIRFFLSPEDQKRVSMIGMENFIQAKSPIGPNDYFILTQPDMDQIEQSKWFKEIKADQTIPYPDGTPGFYVVNLEYVENIDEVIAAEKRKLTEPIEADVQVEGENIKMFYSPIDMGQPKDIFDDDFFPLMRGAAANPYILDFNFSNPRHLTGIFGQFARMDYLITVDLYAPNSDTPVHYEFKDDKITTDVELEMTFDNAPEQVKRVHIEIEQMHPGQTVHIHIRKIKFLS